MSDIDQMFDAIRREYERSGDGEWLMMAATSCLMHDDPAPDWLKDAWRDAYARWQLWEARTLGEAFDVPDRPSDPRSFRRAQRMSDYAGMIYIAVNKRHEAGQPIDQQLFEEIAEGFDFGPTVAKELYYSLKDYMANR